jgi:hypothetical protein
MVNFSQAASWAPEAASNLMRLLPRDFQDAFIQSPNVFMLFMSMAIAAVAVSAYWVLNGMMRASSAARIALRAQALRRN